MVKGQLQEHIDNNSILIDQQSGFRKGFSCETALNFVIADWKMDREERKVIGVVFLDFKRAFETVDRNILIQKLESYGIVNNELNWFQNYLQNRSQQTKFNQTISNSKQNNHGFHRAPYLAHCYLCSTSMIS